MGLCVRTYSSVFGERIMRDERPTSIQNRMKGRTRTGRVHLLTAGVLSCLPLSFVLLLRYQAPSSEEPQRCHAWLRMHHSPLTNFPYELCRTPHVCALLVFVLFSCSCKLLELTPDFLNSCLSHG